MMKKLILRLMIAGLTVLALSASGLAQMDETGMSPQEKDMMAKMEAYATTNANHKLLESMSGAWKATVEHKMGPDAPAKTSEGTSNNVMIFGGKFLEQSFQGDMNGKPFEGKAIMGYDNILKKFQSVWYDSMGTGIMTSTSTYDPEKKTFTEEGKFSCPMTNDQRDFRGVTTRQDADHYTYEIFVKDDSGKEFRMMHIQYVRAKLTYTE